MDDVLRITLIQTSLTWEDPQANRTHFEGIIRSSTDTDLIVLPEMFSSGFTMEPSTLEDHQITVEWMKEQSVQSGSAITGSIVASDQGKYFNRLYFVVPEGEIYTYNKRHTFTLSGEDQVYERGSEKVIISYKGFRICPMICYDLRFPVWSRNVEDFDVLIYVANWPMTRIGAWDTLLKARAIENMVYCIGVNRIGEDKNGLRYNGHSAIYDALGNTLAFSEEEGQLDAVLSKDHLKTTRSQLKFLQDRDLFNLQL